MYHYHLLDAAKMIFQIEKAKQLNSTFDSLYRGQSQELLAGIAPYLFQYEVDSDFALWLREHHGESWGVGIKSSATMEELHKHFRKFLIVKTYEGKELFFRFYDPRVLRAFLPTCDTAQLQEFFGPAQEFFMEDVDPNFEIRFWIEAGQLQINKVNTIEVSTHLH